MLADALGGANDLKLGDLIDGVDVIDALEAIEVGLSGSIYHLSSVSFLD